MMVNDDTLVECKIDDSDEEQINTPPPPPEFASKASTPAPKPPTPPSVPVTPAPTHPVSRDPNGINQHLKVLIPFFALSVTQLCCDSGIVGASEIQDYLI